LEKTYFHVGRKALDALDELAAQYGTISLNNALVRSEVRRRKWLLPPLVRTSTPEPVKRNLLDVALWVFSLYFFPGFALRGIAGFSFQTKLTAGHILPSRGRSTSYGTCFRNAQASASFLTSA
jgi:hypothetical protein